MGLPRNNKLCVYKQHLRTNMTETEKKLWLDFLSGYPSNFVCQKIIGSYIVDFFCNSVRLSIELDGSQHHQPTSLRRDQIRTTYLEMLEIKELRFLNSDVWENFTGVCEIIHSEVQQRRNDLILLPISKLFNKK